MPPSILKAKFLSTNLSKELRQKQGMRNLPVRKGDTVKIMRGSFKGKKGKVTKVFLKLSKVTVENIQIKKKDGSKSDVKLEPSNIQIIELNMDDKRRIKQKAPEKKQDKKQTEEKK